MEFRVIETEAFKDLFAKLERTQKRRIRKKLLSLSITPFQGKPIRVALREFRCNNLRVYFTISSNVQSVYVVGLSDKKEQDEEINRLIAELEIIRNRPKRLIKVKSSMVIMKSKFKPLAQQLRESIEDIKHGRVHVMDFSDLEEKKSARKVAMKKG